MNVLISSAGRRCGLVQIFRTTLASVLAGGRVLAADSSSLCAAGVLADQFELVPPCLTEAFVPHMLKLCQQHSIGLIVPTIDTELPVYAAHRDAFAAVGTTVLVSSPETVAIASDKMRTFEWLAAHGMPTVRTAPLSDVLADRSTWNPPLIAKPLRGSASAGVVQASSWAELEGLSATPGLIVQEIAAGHEYTVDAWADRAGCCRCAVPRRRIEVRGGEVQKAATVSWPALEQLVHDVVHELPGGYGPLNVQIFADGDTFNIIEINPRFGGGYPLSWQAGADFPRWAVEEAAGLPPSTGAKGWRAGIVMLRYDEAVFVEAADVGL